MLRGRAIDDVVDLETVLGEVEEGVRVRRVVQCEQWKEINGAERWRGRRQARNAKEWTGRHTDS